MPLKTPVACVVLSAFCAGLFSPVSSSAAVREASYPVGIRTFHLTDPERLSWDGTAPRPLRTIVWYPAARQSVEKAMMIGPPDRPLFNAGVVAEDAPLIATPERFPLILLSHGTGGSAIQLAWLGTYLAARGYLVAAVNHHGNTAAEGKPTPQGFLLWWERPQDVSQVLNGLLGDPTFGPRVDRQRIGAAGFSLGGYTVISLAGALTDVARYHRFCRSPERDFTCEDQHEFPGANQQFAELEKSDCRVQESLQRAGDSYRDARIRAVFAISPALGEAFTPKSLAAINIPVTITVGAADRIAPARSNSQRIAAGIESAELVVIPGEVGHYEFLDECTEEGKKQLPLYCSSDPTVDRAAVHSKVAGLALDFFDDYLRPASD